MKDKMRLQWLSMEHYRLHIVEEWPDGFYKKATLAAIHSTIERAGQNSGGPVGAPECLICLSRTKTSELFELPPKIGVSRRERTKWVAQE
jgi:hypothetical protein